METRNKERLAELLDKCLWWMWEVIDDNEEYIAVLKNCCGFTKDDALELSGIDDNELIERVYSRINKEG